METQQIKETAGNIAEHTADYLDTFVKVSLLKLTRKITTAVSGAISTLIVCILGMFILFFSGFAAAWWLGDLVGSRAGGFLLLTLFYLLLVIAVVALRKKIIFPFIRDIIVKKTHDE